MYMMPTDGFPVIYVVAPVSRHSEKPREVHERIEQLVAGPFLELFGREEYPGWAVLGNDVDGLDIRDSIQWLLATRGKPEMSRLDHLDHYLSILTQKYHVPDEFLDNP